MQIYHTNISNLDNLLEMYADDLNNNALYISDLKYFALCPYKLAYDLFAQMGLIVEWQSLISNGYPARENYTNDIDLWVDLESIGDVATIKARQLATALKYELLYKHGQMCTLLIIIGNDSLGKENELTLEYISRLLPTLKIHILSTTNTPQIPTNWQPYHLLNTSAAMSSCGIISASELPHFDSDLKIKIILNHDYMFFLSANLVLEQKYHYQLYKKYIFKTEKICESYFDGYQLDYDRAVASIIQYAWKLAELGADEGAVDLLNEACGCSQHPEIKALYIIQLQYLYIASQRYVEAARGCLSYELLDGEWQQQYCLTKAWGATLIKNLGLAAEYFIKAGMPLNQLPSDINSLYRSNIYALWLHLSNQSSHAIKIENSIKATLEEQQSIHYQMRYINAINLARLHRSNSNFTASHLYYDLAFETIKGLYTETDYIYSNICYAILNESNNDYWTAFHCWLRAALHWVVTAYQEALGWRAVRVILKNNFSPHAKLDPGLISQAFYSKLSDLILKLNIQLKKTCTHPIQFMDQKTITSQHQPVIALGGIGWSIFAYKQARSHSKSSQHYSHDVPLAALLGQIVFFLSGCQRDPLTMDILTVVRMHGYEMPTNIHEVISHSVRSQISHINFANKTHKLSTQYITQLKQNLKARISDAVVSITPINNTYNVIYKRYIPARILSSAETFIVKQILSSNSTPVYLSELQKNMCCETVLKLENDHVIRIELDPAMTQKYGNNYAEQNVITTY